MAMPRQDDFDFHFLGPVHGRVKIVNLEPQKHAISVWLGIWVADGAVMVLHFPPVQLQDQSVTHDQSLLANAPKTLSTTEAS
jgi:hypothetical protein